MQCALQVRACAVRRCVARLSVGNAQVNGHARRRAGSVCCTALPRCCQRQCALLPVLRTRHGAIYTTVATHSTSAQSPHDGEPAQRRVRGRGMRKREAVVDMPPAPPPPSPAPQQQQQPPQQLQQQTNAAGKQTVQTPRQEASSSDRAAAPRRGRRGRRRLSARTSDDDTATAAPPAVTRTTPQTSNKNDGDKATTASRKAAPTARRTCDDAAIDAAVAAALAHAPQQQQQQQRPVAAARASPPPPPLQQQQQSTSPPPPPPAKTAATTAMRAAAAALPRNACARIQEHIRRKRLLLQRQKEQQKQQQAQASAPAAAAAAATSASGGATAASSRHSPLFFPDYRERVLDVFEQLAEINTALGERYKAQSYQTARERLRRGDTVFRVLPPNLVPLSPAQEQQLQQQAAAATATSESEAVRDVLAKRAYVQIPTNALPGVGDKLRRKILEILRTGDLAELHVLQAKPIIRAVRELTQMHGFGPRTAVTIYKTYGISTVAELKRYVAEHSDGSDKDKGKSGGAGVGGKVLRLTDAQRVGLQYHDEIVQRMPHDEGRLHEAFLKLRVRKYLGKAYMLTVCGSYRRGTPDSGDIDVLLTRRPESSSSNDNNTASSSGSSSSSSSSATTTATTPAASGVDDTTVLRRFVDALTAEGYMEATLAQGPTKFMGVCRLRSHNSNNNEGSGGSNSKAAARRFVARRIDIRFVDALSYPAALLYFTGSKNFNVIMRAEAIKRHFVLNEYGLFRNPHSQGTRDADGTGKLHDMITRLARAQFYSSSAAAWGGGSDAAAAAAAAAAQTASDGAEDDDDDGGAHTTRRKPRGGGGGGKSVTVEQVRELRELARQVEALRVRVSCEQDIFATIGMSYVTPHDRSL